MSNHTRQQLARLGRLFGVALCAQLAAVLAGTSGITRELIVGAVVAAGEAAWRQYQPVQHTAVKRAKRRKPAAKS